MTGWRWSCWIRSDGVATGGCLRVPPLFAFPGMAGLGCRSSLGGGAWFSDSDSPPYPPCRCPRGVGVARWVGVGLVFRVTSRRRQIMEVG